MSPHDNDSLSEMEIRAMTHRVHTFRSHLPALLVWGMRDWCFRPECLHRLSSLLPQADRKELVEAGHYVMEDATEEVVASICDFFQRHPLTGSAAT